MRNRAKCKLCNDIIESFHRHDYVTCKCGEISVDGGSDYHKCRAIDWTNFLRIDDDGNVFVPKVVDKTEEGQKFIPENVNKPTKQELIQALIDLSKSYEGLPIDALLTPVNHMDLGSLLVILAEILRFDCKADS